MVSVMGKKRIVFSMAVPGEYFAGHGSNRKLIDYVNPFVGTDGYGNVIRVRRFLSEEFR